MTILVCDDSRVPGITLSKILESIGFDVVYADNLEKGRNASKGISAAFVDANIESEFDGVTLIKHIKSSNPDVVAFLFTGETDDVLEKNKELIASSGVDRVVGKVGKAELKKITTELLDEFKVFPKTIAQPAKEKEVPTASTEVSKSETKADRQQKIVAANREQNKLISIEKELSKLSRSLSNIKDRQDRNEDFKTFSAETAKTLKDLYEKLESFESKGNPDVDQVLSELKDSKNRLVSTEKKIKGFVYEVQKLQEQNSSLEKSVDSKTKTIDRAVKMVRDIEDKTLSALSQAGAQQSGKASQNQKLADIDIGQYLDTLDPEKIHAIRNTLGYKESVGVPDGFNDAINDISTLKVQFSKIKGSITSKEQLSNLEKQVDVFHKIIDSLNIEEVNNLQSSMFEQKRDSVKTIKKINAKLDEIKSFENRIQDIIVPVKDSISNEFLAKKEEMTQLASESSSLLEIMSKRMSVFSDSLDDVAQSSIERKLDRMVVDKKLGFEVDFKNAVEEIAKPGGGLATREHIQSYVRDVIRQESDYLNKKYEKALDEFHDKNDLNMRHLCSEIKPSDEDIQNAVKNVAQPALAKRVKRSILPDVISSSLSEVSRKINQRSFKNVLSGGILGLVLSSITFYILFY